MASQDTPRQPIRHALGLHLYQPAGNLRALLRQDAGELRRILLCYERIARHVHKYSAVARLHLALSPLLLQQLRDPELIEACRHLADIPAILDGLRGAAGIEFIGSGYRHAPLPLIPPEDWDEQLGEERLTMEAELGRVPKGYWPPAGLFTAEMVPALARAGYEYVVLPAAALAMPDGGPVDPYRAYRLCQGKDCIVVVPADAGFSQAQEHGLEAPWFADEARAGVVQSPESKAPYLLTTWSDGENGEWFRRLDEEHGFFGQFFSPYMEFCETGEYPVRPALLSDYLAQHRPVAKVGLRPSPAAADTGEAGQAARDRLARAVSRYWSLAHAAATPSGPSRKALRRARELILGAEDSGYLLGDAVRRAAMLGLLDQAERLLQPRPEPAKAPPDPPATARAVPPAAVAAGKRVRPVTGKAKPPATVKASTPVKSSKAAKSRAPTKKKVIKRRP
jgi:hypothetical protein